MTGLALFQTATILERGWGNTWKWGGGSSWKLLRHIGWLAEQEWKKGLVYILAILLFPPESNTATVSIVPSIFFFRSFPFTHKNVSQCCWASRAEDPNPSPISSSATRCWLLLPAELCFLLNGPLPLQNRLFGLVSMSFSQTAFQFKLFKCNVQGSLIS